MTDIWLSIVVGISLLLVAIPYVARIRHPQQKPLAAYLIFMFIFITVAVVLYSGLAMLAVALKVAHLLSQPLPALVFLLLVFLPAIALGTWQARKPPWRQGPPA